MPRFCWHPDHDTIAVFRRRFLKQIEALFVQVLGVARDEFLTQEVGNLKKELENVENGMIEPEGPRWAALQISVSRM